MREGNRWNWVPKVKKILPSASGHSLGKRANQFTLCFLLVLSMIVSVLTPLGSIGGEVKTDATTDATKINSTGHIYLILEGEKKGGTGWYSETEIKLTKTLTSESYMTLENFHKSRSSWIVSAEGIVSTGGYGEVKVLNTKISTFSNDSSANYNYFKIDLSYKIPAYSQKKNVRVMGAKSSSGGTYICYNQKIEENSSCMPLDIEATLSIIVDAAQLGIAAHNGSFYGTTFSEESGISIDYGFNYITPVANENADFVITNTHEDKVQSFEVEKVWNDEENRDKSRPSEITLKLNGSNGKSYSVTLNEKNNWKGKVENVPVYYKQGKKVVYTWSENSWTDPINGGNGLTGNKETGYQVSYKVGDTTTATASPDTKTVVTNEHTPALGTVLLHKKLLASEIPWEKIPDEGLTFTFTLKGKTARENKDLEMKKTVTFTKDEIESIKDADGYVQKDVLFEDIDPGTYTVEESGFEGYYKVSDVTIDKLNETAYEGNARADAISVTDNVITVDVGRNNTYDKTTRIWDTEATFTNEARVGSVKVKKKDADGSALEGVSFVILDKEGKEVGTGKTDENGEISFKDLPIGEYTLRETHTVTGHTLLTDDIKVTVPVKMSEEDAVKERADTRKAVEVTNDDTTHDYYFYDFTYEIANDVSLLLPSTGGWQKWLPLLGAAILVLLGLVLYNRTKKKQMGESVIHEAVKGKSLELSSNLTDDSTQNEPDKTTETQEEATVQEETKEDTDEII